jgi:hypothetical protein
MNHLYVYRLTNEETGQFYIGSRASKISPELDLYKGSMVVWKMSRLEKINLKKEIIKSGFNSVHEMIEYEGDIIRNCIKDPLNENYAIPHPNFQTYGKVTVKTEFGKIILVSKQDKEYLNGNLKFMHCGKVTVKDKDSIIMIDVTDPRYISGELKFMHCGMVNVIDVEGNHFKISNKDPKFLSGELKSSSKDTVLVYDKNGNKIRVSLKDPRYINGELKFIAKGKVSVKDKDGNQFYVDRSDPRFLSRELVGTSKGYWSWRTKIKINNLVENARFFSMIYNIRIKDLKQYLEENTIPYEKIT